MGSTVLSEIASPTLVIQSSPSSHGQEGNPQPTTSGGALTTLSDSGGNIESRVSDCHNTHRPSKSGSVQLAACLTTQQTHRQALQKVISGTNTPITSRGNQTMSQASSVTTSGSCQPTSAFYRVNNNQDSESSNLLVKYASPAVTFEPVSVAPSNVPCDREGIG